MEDLVLESQLQRSKWKEVIGFAVILLIPIASYFINRKPTPWFLPLTWYLLCCLMVYKTKRPLKLTLSPLNYTLSYEFVNGFGMYKSITVDLKKPVYYDYEYTAEGSKFPRWRLRAFNSYLFNLIQVYGNRGFSKEQLDYLDTEIMKLKRA